MGYLSEPVKYTYRHPLAILVSSSAYSHDLGVAAGTGRCEELSIAVLTVNIILLLHKADIGQGRVAIMAVKLLWMPGTTQCYQEWSPEGSE